MEVETTKEESCAIETSTTEKPVCLFYLEGKCRFGEKCFNLHPANVSVPEKTRPKDDVQEEVTEAEETVDPEDADFILNEKKPPLRTSGDVRKRIQWDSDLPEEYFTVGYLDRFEGMLEKPFSAFTWKHLALVDIDELAIPQHRIHYFKYKGRKVWDKTERLDHVFGSAGNEMKIKEVMQEVDEELARAGEGFDPDDDSDCDSDDDDDLIVIGGSSVPGKGLVANLREGEMPQKEILRATHFICIRVKNEAVKEAVAMVQEHIVKEEPILRSCAMPNELLHVTLAMLHLGTPDALLAVTNLIEELQPRLRELVHQTPSSEARSDSAFPSEDTIRAKGLSTFGARVLFSKLQIPSSFTAVVDMIYEALRLRDDVIVTNHFDFVPHMTLLKVNRPTARERRSKYLNSQLYSEYIDLDFGNIAFDNINLCVIDDVRGPDGFYLTCKRIDF